MKISFVITLLFLMVFTGCSSKEGARAEQPSSTQSASPATLNQETVAQPAETPDERNNKGWKDQFQYLERDGEVRYARATESYFDANGTHDSEWFVKKDGVVTGPFPELTFLGQDGFERKAVFLNSCSGGWNWVRFETWQPGNPHHETKELHILDANRTKWRVLVQNFKPCKGVSKFWLETM